MICGFPISQNAQAKNEAKFRITVLLGELGIE